MLHCYLNIFDFFLKVDDLYVQQLRNVNSVFRGLTDSPALETSREKAKKSPKPNIRCYSPGSFLGLIPIVVQATHPTPR